MVIKKPLVYNFLITIIFIIEYKQQKAAPK